MNFHLKTPYYDGPAVTQVRTYPSQHGGGTALQIFTPDGEELCIVSVNLIDWGYHAPPEGEIWVKTWSENKGLAEALEEAGVIKILRERAQGPYDCVAFLATLTEK